VAEQLFTLCTQLLAAVLLLVAAPAERPAETPTAAFTSAAPAEPTPVASDARTCAIADPCQAARMRWQITLATPAARRCPTERCAAG
jgi:hypothetical protein